MKIVFRGLFYGFAFVAIASSIAIPAQAQRAHEEVIVTARQRAELISDVPASIKAFSAQDIERAGIERAEDFIILTPGVSMVNTAEVGDTQVSIRGINGARDGEANLPSSSTVSCIRIRARLTASLPTLNKSKY
jgi:iron complex outermembrane receptor protein